MVKLRLKKPKEGCMAVPTVRTEAQFEQHGQIALCMMIKNDTNQLPAITTYLNERISANTTLTRLAIVALVIDCIAATLLVLVAAICATVFFAEGGLLLAGGTLVALDAAYGMVRWGLSDYNKYSSIGAWLQDLNRDLQQPGFPGFLVRQRAALLQRLRAEADAAYDAQLGMAQG
jgi:hypothetical protein